MRRSRFFLLLFLFLFSLFLIATLATNQATAPVSMSVCCRERSKDRKNRSTSDTSTRSFVAISLFLLLLHPRKALEGVATDGQPRNRLWLPPAARPPQTEAPAAPPEEVASVPVGRRTLRGPPPPPLPWPWQSCVPLGRCGGSLLPGPWRRSSVHTASFCTVAPLPSPPCGPHNVFAIELRPHEVSVKSNTRQSVQQTCLSLVWWLWWLWWLVVVVVRT